MKEVNFLKAGMENFCCHIDPMEIVFENSKLTTITGPNGVGKTAIFQSIPYTLYGICEKGKAEDVLNDKVGKNCHTFVEFDIDGDLYRVDRYVKYTKLGSTVTITKNGGKPYKKGHREVVPEVEKLLVPRKLFTNTLLFSQKVKTFFTDLTDSEQKDIFRKILTLEEFVKYHTAAGKKLIETSNSINELEVSIRVSVELRQEIMETIEEQKRLREKFKVDQATELESLQRRKEEYVNNLAETNTKYQEYQNQNIDEKLKLVTEKLTLLTEKLSSLEGTLKTQVDAIQLRMKVKQGEFDTKAQELKNKSSEEMRKVETSLRNLYTVKKEELDKQIIGIDGEKSTIEAQMVSIRTSIEFFQKDIENFTVDPNVKEMKTCPVCLQEITPDCFKKFDEERAKIEVCVSEEGAKLKGLEEKILVLNSQREEVESKIDALNSEFEDALNDAEKKKDSDYADIDKRSQDAKEKLQKLAQDEVDKVSEASRHEHNETVDQKQNVIREKNALDALAKEQTEVYRDVCNLEQGISNIDENIARNAESTFDESILISSQDKLSKLEEETKQVELDIIELKKKLSVIEFWQDGFSAKGIQSMLIDDAIPFMNDRVSNYLSGLSNGRYSVSFDTMSTTKSGEFRDKISVHVFDNITHANARIKLSGGQERLVDIATILTLADLQSNVQNVKFNILLFDEIFDALDDENINGVSRLLRMVAHDKSMFIISHRHIDSIESDEELMFGRYD